MVRHGLIAVSLALHLCILDGVVVSGSWRLERLDAGPPRLTLAPPPPTKPLPRRTPHRPRPMAELYGPSTGHDDRAPRSNLLNRDGGAANCPIQVPPPVPARVPPGALAGLRISGQTRVIPDEATRVAMLRDGRVHTRGALKVCITAEGCVSSTRLLMSTRYPAYDAALIEAVAAWRYRPYPLDGIAVPVCSAVSFLYTLP
jgi:outer membrane biosynthesis protein TonB